MNFPFAPPPEEDSPDLTDEEIRHAKATERVEDIEGAVRGHTCPACSAAFSKAEHELRRRMPSLFWRIRLTCVGAGHVSLMTFKVDWLNRR